MTEWDERLDKAAADAYARLFPFTGLDSGGTFGIWWRSGYKAALVDVADEVDRVMPDGLTTATVRTQTCPGCAVGIETEAKWCGIAAERCAQMTIGDAA